MNNDKQNILVAGANGKTGRIIINLLKDSDKYNPIAMVRKQEQKERFEKENVTTVLADLENDLTEAVKNVDKVIFTAGSGGEDIIQVDQEGAKRLADAAKTAKVKKYVMLSSMGTDNPSSIPQIEDYLKAKHNAEEYLKISGLDYSIVRPGALKNDDGTGKIELSEKLGKSGKISRHDVAKTLVGVLDDDIQYRKVLEIITGESPIEEAIRS
ncbi:MAG TPA: SDR family oxidoreductase [Chitinophagales bacterium]|nr:SDR family oxidoreductase [Chitinophagales bacterium]